jgi:hypothetical protein
MANGKFRLLDTFRHTFQGTVYKHRNSTLGNKIGRALFEDLLKHNVSTHFMRHVDTGLGVVNIGGKVHGKRLRRNDSAFGKPPAAATTRAVVGFAVREGPMAEPRIGCEVKIIAKSQQKQIDRVINDLEGFARRTKALNKRCINIAIVAVNHESDYEGHEGQRTFRNALREGEPEHVTARLDEELAGLYDELLVFRFRATNQPPYPFTWLDDRNVDLDYGAALARIGEKYQRRFR